MGMGTLIHDERILRQRAAMPGRRMQPVCTGTLVNYYEQVVCNGGYLLKGDRGLMIGAIGKL